MVSFPLVSLRTLSPKKGTNSGEASISILEKASKTQKKRRLVLEKNDG